MNIPLSTLASSLAGIDQSNGSSRPWEWYGDRGNIGRSREMLDKPGGWATPPMRSIWPDDPREYYPKSPTPPAGTPGGTTTTDVLDDLLHRLDPSGLDAREEYEYFKQLDLEEGRGPTPPESRPRSLEQMEIDDVSRWRDRAAAPPPIKPTSPHRTGRLTTPKSPTEFFRSLGEGVSPGGLKDTARSLLNPKNLLRMTPAAIAEIIAMEGGLAVGQALSPMIYEPLPGPGGEWSVPGLGWAGLSGTYPATENPYAVKGFGKPRPGEEEWDDRAIEQLLHKTIPSAFGYGPAMDAPGQVAAEPAGTSYGDTRTYEDFLKEDPGFEAEWEREKRKKVQLDPSAGWTRQPESINKSPRMR